MASPGIPLVAAATASTAPHATLAVAVDGSNIGPALPVILLLAVVGLVIYIVRTRKGRTPKDRDE